MRLVLIIVFSCIITGISAQQDSVRYVHKGLWRAMATFSFPAEKNLSMIYIHGNLEYYTDEIISIRNDGYYSLQINSPFPDKNYNHSFFTGASYHIKTKGRLDPYAAFQPGLSLTKETPGYCPPNVACIAKPFYQSRPSVNPLLSGVIGFNYYGEKYFHFFGEARYVHGKHLSELPRPVSLSELRLSFGLGFNIN